MGKERVKSNGARIFLQQLGLILSRMLAASAGQIGGDNPYDAASFFGVETGLCSFCGSRHGEILERTCVPVYSGACAQQLSRRSSAFMLTRSLLNNSGFEQGRSTLPSYYVSPDSAFER